MAQLLGLEILSNLCCPEGNNDRLIISTNTKFNGTFSFSSSLYYLIVIPIWLIQTDYVSIVIFFHKIYHFAFHLNHEFLICRRRTVGRSGRNGQFWRRENWWFNGDRFRFIQCPSWSKILVLISNCISNFLFSLGHWRHKTFPIY